ncbi:hypothetical protein F5Y16DRAFT_396656 [Xylariaceae sp. FL0255]|nr:hypothetical protein F5Y16DRAFT_396656 [Xylariaceae sp. FL0255]
MPSMASFATLLSLSTAILGVALPETSAVSPTATCATGSPVTTAGYTISYYTEATPTPGAFVEGYAPKADWASQHLVGTYTFGVPTPVETGFAYAQFKCQYYCENMSRGGSFYVSAAPDTQVGASCNCFNEIMDPTTFVSDSEALVGAFNAICSAP